jgi:CheY-like chemotaxis protein
VLIIDDGGPDGSRQPYTWALRAGGWSVGETDSSQVLFATALFEPDVIVVNLGRPPCSGVEIGRRIRNHGSTAHIPTVICAERAAGWSHEHRDDQRTLRAPHCSAEELRTLLHQLIANPAGPGALGDKEEEEEDRGTSRSSSS